MASKNTSLPFTKYFSVETKEQRLIPFSVFFVGVEQVFICPFFWEHNFCFSHDVFFRFFFVFFYQLVDSKFIASEVTLNILAVLCKKLVIVS